MTMELDRIGSYRVQAGREVGGRVRVPASKSVVQRYLALALVGRLRLRLEHVTAAEDPRLFAAALATCGFNVEWRDDVLHVEPPTAAPATRAIEGGATTIFCGNGGTMCRFLTAVLTTVPGRWRIAGVPRLHERPIGPLVDALRQLGAEIRYVADHGFPPLDIVGGSLDGGSASLDAGASSQYLSAILLAGQGARRAIEVVASRLASSPYVELTADVVRERGGRVEVDARSGRYRTAPRPLAAGTIAIEGDFSAAAYPAAAAALAGGEVRIAGLEADSTQGDRRLLEVLVTMGVPVAWQGRDLVVRRAPALRAIDIDLSSMPDQVPTIAALAPFAAGRTTISGVAHLRLKESDRLAAMTTELGRLGVPIEQTGDGLVIDGVWADCAPPAGEVSVRTYGDHRIAMALAVVGLRRPGVVILAPEVVEKSYPAFWCDLEALIGAS